MPRMTSAELLAYQTRQNAKKGSQEDSGGGCRREKDLHGQIEAELKRLGWYYVHSRMDKPATNQLGTVDFIIAVPERRAVFCGLHTFEKSASTLWLECKTKEGKLSTAQLGVKMMLEKSGHHWALCRSIEQFHEILKGL